MKGWEGIPKGTDSVGFCLCKLSSCHNWKERLSIPEGVWIFLG